MDDRELTELVERMRDLMVAVATGGPRIDDVNADYKESRREVNAELARRRIDDPNPYGDLWEWYGKWSSDLPTWASRRAYLAELFNPLLDALARGATWAETRAFAQPTGWALVDRQLGEARKALEGASREEHFQSVGLLCREAVISLAQAVYDPDRHPSTDGIEPSPTDAKRMLESYVAVELASPANDDVRTHARASLRLALSLQHDRTAGFRKAALCLEATSSLVNVIAIIAGRRDPE
jgi:hypothetical protein